MKRVAGSMLGLFRNPGAAVPPPEIPLPAPSIERLGKPPFGLADLAPVPEDWEIGPPDFVGIAAGRSGTTWWYQLLLDHPTIKPNRRALKELYYFYYFGYQGLDAAAADIYCHTFARPKGGVCGEWSPGYLTHPLVVNYLAQVVPHAKLLAIVRNPIDRLVSAINHEYAGANHALGLTGEREFQFLNFSLLPRVVLNSFLDLHFAYLFRFFDPGQVLVLQYEQCKRDPAGEIAKTYRFLGVDDSFVPDHLRQPINVDPYLLPKPDAKGRAMLAEYFSDDVRAFARRCPHIDLSLWTDFKP